MNVYVIVARQNQHRYNYDVYFAAESGQVWAYLETLPKADEDGPFSYEVELHDVNVLPMGL